MKFHQVTFFCTKDELFPNVRVGDNEDWPVTLSISSVKNSFSPDIIIHIPSTAQLANFILRLQSEYEKVIGEVEELNE